MIQAVLFDLDGTLFDRTTSVTRCIQQQYEAFSTILANVAKTKYLTRFLSLDEHGYVSKNVVYQRMGVEFGLQSTVVDQLYADYLARYHQTCLGFINLETMLTCLMAQGIRLGIVTNGWTEFQQATISALGIGKHFKAVLISETEGVRKPDPAIFLRALRRVEASPVETIFVGDNPQTDIAGAKQVGIRGIWKRDSYWGDCPEAEWVIDDLLEIVVIVEEENRH